MKSGLLKTKEMNKKIDKEYYNEYFEDNQYSKFKDLNSFFQKYRISNVLKLYTPNNNEYILDLGCGWGTFCFAIAPFCKEVTGIDYNQNGVDLCYKLLEKYKFPNVKFVCADAQDTGLKSESYDVIICADLFEHLYPDTFEKVLDECKRLLKRGGKLVIWTPCRGHFLEKLKNNNLIIRPIEGHVDYKSMEYLIESLEKRHFLIKKRYYGESHIPIFNRLEKLLMGSLPFLRRRIAILAEKNNNY